MTYPPAGEPGPQAGPVPVCPRHPDRASYVRCQRCERPVCPQCQRPAAVGVQCVDCVRQQARSTPVARTVFGGRAGQIPPRITLTVIIACVLVQLLELVRGDAFVASYSFVPFEAAAEPWRFITSAFLHSRTFLPHILFNMYALWVIGPFLERMVGAVRYAALYLLSAVGGSVGYFLLATPSGAYAGSWTTGAVGASGAIFGLFAALVVVNRKLGRDTAGIVGIIVINGVLGFIPGLGIAWQAHLGGLVTGGLVAFALTAPSRERRAVMQPLGLTMIALVLLLLVLWKLGTVPAGLLA